ncbi:MAG: PAS domain S-box protein [Desulfobacterales bacterium]|nr:PAS domain S-box protein [Desulfobacterales bacterium]
MKRIFVIWFYLAVFLIVHASVVSAQKTNIFYINSYESGYTWSDNILEGIHSIFTQSGLTYDLQIEYMDSKKYPGPEMERHLLAIYRTKLSYFRPDVILVSDNNAFRFAIDHRNELFKGIPIVFCGVNDFSPELLKGEPQVTGVAEAVDISGNINIALKLHPSRNRIVVITDSSATGRAMTNAIQKEFPGRSRNLQIEFIDMQERQALFDTVRQASPETIFFFIPQYRAGNGTFYGIDDIFPALERNTQAPIYSFWKFFIGHGVVGGRLTSGLLQGKTAAAMALAIIKGTPASDIPVSYDAQYHLIFDHHQLLKFGITKAQLPKGAEVINAPQPFYRLNRELFWVLVICFGILSVVLIFLIINIDEMKKAQTNLQKAEKRYRSIFENASKGIFLADLSGHILNINNAFAQMLGYKNQNDALAGMETIQKHYASSETGAQLRRYINEGKDISGFEIEFYTTQKEKRWASINATLVKNKAGTIEHVEGICEDITKRKEAEIAVGVSKDKLQMVLDNIPQLVYWQDETLTYVGGNRSFKLFYGLPEHHEVNACYEEIICEKDAEVSRKLDGSIIQAGTPRYRIKRPLRKKVDGKEVCLEVNKIPLTDKTGKVTGLLGTAEDITRKVNLEKQLFQAQKMEALGTLSGGIAHDFNNILTSIINSTELALEEVETQSMAASDLKRVLKASARGSELVNRIVAFSRPSREEFQIVNVTEIVEETLSLFEATITGNIHLTRDTRCRSCICLADPTQLHQVIMNLCTNSFQAMRKVGGKIGVTVNTAEVEPSQGALLNLTPGSYCRIAICDNGPGIAESHIDKIFDPFFTTKEKGVGTGLGLAVAHGILKSHRGNIVVTSLPEVKTTFEVYLPRTLQEESPGVHAADRPKMGTETILFVEDDKEQRETVPRVLNRLGYKVLVAKDTRHALSLFAAHQSSVDLVITDFDMPGENGFALAAHLHEMDPGCPVIIVSGRQKSLSLKRTPNVCDVILKPYNRQSLSKSINRALHNETKETP